MPVPSLLLYNCLVAARRTARYRKASCHMLFPDSATYDCITRG